MSAFVVDKEHIDAIVTLAVRGPSETRGSGPGGCWHGFYWLDADSHMQASENASPHRLGAVLWGENLRSINWRYPDTLEGGIVPGPCDFTEMSVAAYVWPASTRQLGAVAGLKAIQSYEYQASEHPDWVFSEARRVCDALLRALVFHVPGYAEADWAISAGAA